jgi:hypothetical protein
MKALKAQIDKMGREARLTGQPQFWINRREVLPELSQYARKTGVVALGNVKTGHSPVPSSISWNEASNLMEREFRTAGRTRIAGAGGQFAFGAWMLFDAAPRTLDDIQALLTADGRSATDAWLRLGENASYSLAGGGMVLSSGASMTSMLAREVPQGRLYNLGRFGGYASGATFVIAEGFVVARYMSGDLSSRDLLTSQWILGSTFVGARAGSWAGRLAGGYLGPGGAIAGSLAGAIVGERGGKEFGQYTAGEYYDWKFGNLDRDFGVFVYAKYGVK